MFQRTRRASRSRSVPTFPARPAGPSGVEFLESRVLLAGVISPSGDVTVQVEDARLSGAVVDDAFPGFISTGYVDYLTSSGSFADLEVDLPTSGRRNIEIRYALVQPSPSPELRMRLEVNGVAQPQDVVFAPTGAWDQWNMANAVATVPAGRSHLRLVATGQGGPNVDSMTIHAPLGEPPASPTFQAETAILGGARVDRAHRGYTGAGYVDYVNNAGDFVEFRFETSDPGTNSHRLLFRYANGGNAPRPMVLRLDHSDVVYGLTFQPTGSWTNWQTTGIDVHLGTGAHAARLTAVGSSGPNLDSMSLVGPVHVERLYAERARFSGPAFSRQHSGYLGTGGYADFVRDSGDWIEWTTDLPSTGAGEYSVSVWYANGGRTDRPLELKVTAADGRTVTRTVNFAPTGGWTRWSDATVSVPMFAGTQRIRLTSVGSNGPNVSSVLVTSLRPPPPSPRTFPDFNDQAAEATAAPVGGEQFLEIDHTADVDVLRLDVAAGQKLAFDVDRASGNLDGYVRLFDASSRQIAANDNGAGPGESSGGVDPYLEFTFPRAGAYYVAFSDKANIGYEILNGSGDRAGGTGHYRLTVLDNGGPVPAPTGSDTDDQLSEAKAAPFETLFSDQSISSATDVDLYRTTLYFDLGEPAIQLTLRHDATAHLLLRLFDANGRELARSRTTDEDRTAYINLMSEGIFNPPGSRSGDYYVGVSAVPNGQYDPRTGSGDAGGGGTSAYELDFFTFDGLPPTD